MLDRRLLAVASISDGHIGGTHAVKTLGPFGRDPSVAVAERLALEAGRLRRSETCVVGGGGAECGSFDEVDCFVDWSWTGE